MLSRLTRHPDRIQPLVLPRHGYRLHAMVAAAGRERRSVEPGGTPYDHHGQRRGAKPYVLIQHTLAGAGWLRHDGTTQRVRAGQTMLLTFPHDHRYWLEAGGGWSFFWVTLMGGEVVRAWQRVITDVGPVLTLGDEHDVVQWAAGLCADVLDGRLGEPWETSASAYALAMALLSAGLRQHAAPRLDERPTAVLQAIKYAEEHLHEGIGIEALAHAAGLSRHHFSRRFQLSEGVSPGVYLRRLRLDAAMKLLRDTDQPTKAIASSCGFPDANYLGKAMKKRYGVTPAALRKGGAFGTADTR